MGGGNCSAGKGVSALTPYQTQTGGPGDLGLQKAGPCPSLLASWEQRQRGECAGRFQPEGASRWRDLYPHLPGHVSHSSPKGRAGSSFLASLRGQSVGRSHYFRGQQWSMRRRREVFPRLSCDSVLTSPKNIPEQLGPESYIFK